jgi:hypothetical protein
MRQLAGNKSAGDAIIFEGTTRDRLWVNRSPGGCPELRDRALVTHTTSDQLCRGDIADRARSGQPGHLRRLRPRRLPALPPPRELTNVIARSEARKQSSRRPSYWIASPGFRRGRNDG